MNRNKDQVKARGMPMLFGANFPSASRIFFVGLLGLLSGCVASLAPANPVNPAASAVLAALEMPTQYRNALQKSTTETSTATSLTPSSAEWWRQYASPELDSLVQQSLEKNPELRIASRQIEQARIRAKQALAGKLPKVSAPLVAVAQSSGGSADVQQSSRIGLQASFKLDVWGEQSALIESANLQYWRAVHARENIQINLLASLVSNYLAYLSSTDSLASADQQLVIGSALLTTVEQRLALGDANLLDVEQQRLSLYSQQSLRAGLDNQREEFRSTIARLVGVLPSQLQLRSAAATTQDENNQFLLRQSLQLPVIDTDDAGLPSSLLLRRPDIRMMESRMRSANADIDVARARLLPPLDLSAQAGYSAMSVAKLLQPQNLLVSSLASLTFIVFDGGLRRDDQAFAQAYYEEMLETYRMTILQAMRDVEIALAAVRAARLRWEVQTRASESNLSMLSNASLAYGLAAIDSGTFLDNQKNYQRSLDDSQRARFDFLRSYASLFQALGYGYTPELAADSPKPELGSFSLAR